MNNWPDQGRQLKYTERRNRDIKRMCGIKWELNLHILSINRHKNLKNKKQYRNNKANKCHKKELMVVYAHPTNPKLIFISILKGTPPTNVRHFKKIYFAVLSELWSLKGPIRCIIFLLRKNSLNICYSMK